MAPPGAELIRFKLQAPGSVVLVTSHYSVPIISYHILVYHSEEYLKESPISKRQEANSPPPLTDPLPDRLLSTLHLVNCRGRQDKARHVQARQPCVREMEAASLPVFGSESDGRDSLGLGLGSGGCICICSGQWRGKRLLTPLSFCDM